MAENEWSVKDSISLICFFTMVFFFVAGTILLSAGSDLKSLRSVGGTSVAESYYQKIGSYGTAYGLICYAFALGTLLVSLVFRKLLDKEKRLKIRKKIKLTKFECLNCYEISDIEKKEQREFHEKGHIFVECPYCHEEYEIDSR